MISCHPKSRCNGTTKTPHRHISIATSTLPKTTELRSGTQDAQHTSHLAKFEAFAKRNNINSPEDWYKISGISLKSRDPILFNYIHNHFHTSLPCALQTVYPEYDWQLWRFSKVPHRFWIDQGNQKKWLNWAGNQLGVTKLDDWYKVTVKSVLDLGGAGLLRLHNKSLHKALSATYPEHSWTSWSFRGVAKGFWEKEGNQRKLFDWISQQLNIKHWEDWYAITSEDIARVGGHSLIANRYNGSLSKALSTIYPENNWEIWRFKKAPARYWQNIANQKKSLEWIGMQLGVSILEDWYKVKATEVRALGGQGLLYYNDQSLIKALQTIYPDYNWDQSKFSRMPRNFWNVKSNRLSVIRKISQNLNIQDPNVWMTVTNKMFSRLGGRSILAKHGTINNALKALEPSFSWKVRRRTPQSKSQTWLTKIIHEIFPNVTVHHNYRDPDMAYSTSNRAIPFDIYIPSMSLMIDFIGPYDYNQHFKWGSLPDMKVRNTEKLQACQKRGITFVEIPSWWDMTKESLLSILRQSRPDLARL